jgi:taurine--2-oxoglutarate transaminase
VMKSLMLDLQDKHEIVGAVRSLGLFGIIELVKDKQSMEPLAPFNGTSEPMNMLRKIFRDEGLYTFVRYNYFFANPPLIVTEEELRHGFDIFDRALTAIA